MNVLFVCDWGEIRSKTAAEIFANKNTQTKYVGIHNTINRTAIRWADKIIVMMPHQEEFIKTHFKSEIQTKEVQCVNIKPYLGKNEETLIKMLKEKITV